MLLDTMRKHSRSFIIYIFFGIIIAVFVVNFGPQSAGCVAGTTYAGSIAGREITLNDFTYAIGVSGLRRRSLDDNQMARAKAGVMDRYIARELLAREAERRGMSVDQKHVRDMLLKGRFFALGQSFRGQIGFDKDNKFDYDRFSRYVRYAWGITVKKFNEQQRRELLAEKLRESLRAAVQVSEAEVKADFEHRGTRAKVSYVRFAPAEFRDKVELSDAKIAAYIKANEAKLKKHYETNKATAYSKLPAQSKLAVIEVSYAKAGADGKTPDKAAALTKAKALHARLAKEKFAAVAKDGSDHASAKTGGQLGWRNVAKLGFGGKALGDALGKLAKGKVSEVIEGEKSAWIVEVQGKRKGDISFDQAKDEIARDRLADEESRRLASAAAETFIKRAQKGEKLEDLFTTEADAKAAKDAKADGKEGEAKPKAKSPLRLRSTAFFARSPYNLIPGIGISKPLMKAAFKLKKGTVAKAPFKVQSMIYLARVDERKEADMKVWEKRKNDLITQTERMKAAQQIQHLTYELCQKSLKSNELKVQQGFMAPPQPPGAVPQKIKKPIMKYEPCKTLKPMPAMGGFGGLGGMRGLRRFGGGGRRPF